MLAAGKPSAIKRHMVRILDHGWLSACASEVLNLAKKSNHNKYELLNSLNIKAVSLNTLGIQRMNLYAVACALRCSFICSEVYIFLTIEGINCLRVLHCAFMKY